MPDSLGGLFRQPFRPQQHPNLPRGVFLDSVPSELNVLVGALRMSHPHMTYSGFHKRPRQPSEHTWKQHCWPSVFRIPFLAPCTCFAVPCLTSPDAARVDVCEVRVERTGKGSGIKGEVHGGGGDDSERIIPCI